MKILITGAAGFIGFHLSKKLLERGDEVVGLDNINDYYDINLKFDRLKELGIEKKTIKYGIFSGCNKSKFRFIRMNLEDRENIHRLFQEEKFDKVCNLAAQAGVRYSIENPAAYIDSNVVGFLNILEGARHNNIKHLVYASSSSVYGMNKKTPFSTTDSVDHPVSLYAATKKSNELMAHTYSHLYNIPTTGLRFFTVYGPWGRPDMAYFKFTNKIMKNETIDIYNNGEMQRDFTYIDDIVDGIIKVIDSERKVVPEKNQEKSAPESSSPLYKLYNIGNNKPVKLMTFVEELERKLSKTANKNFMPMQPGDVYVTWADVDELIRDFDYKPDTTIDEGLGKFVNWYKEYYKD